MESKGENPNKVTFVGILTACSHAKLLSAICMSEDYGIVPIVEHYKWMVDVLARAKHLNIAADFIKDMPIAPSASTSEALLRAYKTYRNVKLGKYSVVKMSRARIRQCWCLCSTSK